ncbi:lipase family protein [Variovorax sp. RA8]|uniref:lipase family protein n=1 Tax=Variovorax sp. (strain JCM 16519 / RA8) TaxID=662548 RepID=UPI000A6C4312|nr:hypothetical protein [Variovorax sp. RA8]VTU13664.1 putative lipase [Variovorax sp. RA8]
MNPTIRTLSASLLAIACTGCISLQQTEDQVAIRPPGKRLIAELRPYEPEARRHLPYAWLSQSAYEKTPAGKEEADPCRDADQALGEAHWKRWDGFPREESLKTEIEKYHLRVEVWSKESPPQVAVAFGGTVFDNRNDWRANLRWFLPKHDDQYTLVVKHLGPAFNEEFKRRMAQREWGDAKPSVVSTGHSLGGGLAQQFAYALPLDGNVPRVSRVYAFHPSPVTGYFSVEQHTREKNSEDLEIERIYERGEILALLRSLQSVFFKPSEADPVVTGYRYSVVLKADPVKDHSLGKFACALAEKLGMNGARVAKAK